MSPTLGTTSHPKVDFGSGNTDVVLCGRLRAGDVGDPICSLIVSQEMLPVVPFRT